MLLIFYSKEEIIDARRLDYRPPFPIANPHHIQIRATFHALEIPTIT